MQKIINKNYLKYLLAIIFVVIFVALPFSNANAAISRVQTTAIGNNSPTITATWPAPTTAGNLLVAIISVRGGTGRTITPPAGLGWTLAKRSDNGTTISTAIYYIQNAASQSGGSLWTLNVSSRATLTLVEYSGVAISSALDQTGGTSGTGVTGNSGTTLTTTQANEVVVAGISANNSSRTYSAQSSAFTEVSEVNSGGTSNGCATVFEEKIVSAVNAQNVTALISASSVWVGAIATFKESAGNPVPTTTSISPTSKVYGEAQFTLTVNGTNFISSSVVNFAGSARTTTFVSATQLTAIIPATDLLTVGSYNITVTNPAPGGGTSNAQIFAVNKATQATLVTVAQTVTSPTAFAPLSTTGGSGTGAVSYVVTSAGTAGCSVIGTTLSYTSTGTCTVTATKAADANYLVASSVAQTFTVTASNPVPTTTSISPTSIAVGSVGFTLTVNGTNFISSSVVNFEGSARATTYVSSTQLTSLILTSDLTAIGTFNITVTNPSPGGGTSNAQTFTVGNAMPTTTSISPILKTSGEATFTLTVNGTNFISSSVVNFAGSPRTTTFASSTQVTATILASDLLTAGSFLITVTNPSPGGGTSNSQVFTVHNTIPSITSIYPPSVAVGSAQFTMTINGVNFVSNSQVKFGANVLATTYISATQLTAVVPLSYLILAGTFSITVYNPSTAETSNSQSFTVGALGRHEFNYSKTFYGSGSLKRK